MKHKPKPSLPPEFWPFSVRHPLPSVVSLPDLTVPAPTRQSKPTLRPCPPNHVEVQPSLPSRLQSSASISCQPRTQATLPSGPSSTAITCGRNYRLFFLHHPSSIIISITAISCQSWSRTNLPLVIGLAVHTCSCLLDINLRSITRKFTLFITCYKHNHHTSCRNCPSLFYSSFHPPPSERLRVFLSLLRSGQQQLTLPLDDPEFSGSTYEPSLPLARSYDPTHICRRR